MKTKPSYKVESGIDMPRKGGGRIANYPFLDMKRGDSFFIPCKDLTEQVRARSRVWSAGKTFGKHNGGCKFITRIVDGGVRCWRYE